MLSTRQKVIIIVTMIMTIVVILIAIKVLYKVQTKKSFYLKVF